MAPEKRKEYMDWTKIASMWGVIIAIIGSSVYIKSTMVIHEYRIGQIEKVNEKQDGEIQLLLSRPRNYYLPKQK